MFDGPGAADDCSVKHLQIIDFAGDIVRFADQAVNGGQSTPLWELSARSFIRPYIGSMWPS